MSEPPYRSVCTVGDLATSRSVTQRRHAYQLCCGGPLRVSGQRRARSMVEPSWAREVMSSFPKMCER